MNPNVYRWCAVPQCKNTSIKTPKKIFVNVPMKKMVRDRWLNLARRDPATVSSNSVIYFCEDHFDLPNDMENYIQYHVMGTISKVKMKSGCVPTRFELQPGKRIRTPNTTEQPCVPKKQRKMLIEESEKYLAEKRTPTKHIEPVGSSSETPVLETIEEHYDGSPTYPKTCDKSVQVYTYPKTCDKSVQVYDDGPTTYPKSCDKSVQVYITYKFRSKAVQTEFKLVNQSTSPMKPDRCSVSTSPFKIKSCGSTKPGTSSIFEFSKIIVEQSDSDTTSYSPSISQQETSSSTKSLQMKSTSDCSELSEETKKEEAFKILNCTLIKIMKNPRSYIGLPKCCTYLLDIIEEQTRIPTNHILLCLKKN